MATGWLADLLGIREVQDSGGNVLPPRRRIRFLSGTAVDNPGNGSTDVTPPGGSGGSGDFVGPGSSTDNAIVRFNGTTGKSGQNSLATIDDTGTLSLPGAVKATLARILWTRNTGVYANDNPGPDFYADLFQIVYGVTNGGAVSINSIASPGKPVARVFVNQGPDVWNWLQNTAGSTENRILVSTGGNYAQQVGEASVLLYDTEIDRWRVQVLSAAASATPGLAAVLAAGNFTNVGQVMNFVDEVGIQRGDVQVIGTIAGEVVFSTLGVSISFQRAGQNIAQIYDLGAGPTAETVITGWRPAALRITTTAPTGAIAPNVVIKPGAPDGNFSGSDVEIFGGAPGVSGAGGDVRIGSDGATAIHVSRDGEGSELALSFFGEEPVNRQDALLDDFSGSGRRTLEGLYNALGTAGYGLLDTGGVTNGQKAPPTTSVSNVDSPYTVLDSDEILLVNTSAGVVDLALPGANRRCCFVVKDAGGAAATNRIRLKHSAVVPTTGTIEGAAADKDLMVPRGAWFVFSDGTNYWVNGPS